MTKRTVWHIFPRPYVDTNLFIYLFVILSITRRSVIVRLDTEDCKMATVLVEGMSGLY